MEPEVLKASRLPRRKQRRPISPSSSPSFRGHLWRPRKHHACHANGAWGAGSVTPATQRAAGQHADSRGAQSDLGCRQASADLYEGLESGLESATPVTQIKPALPKVPRLSRGKPRRPIRPRMSPSFRWPLWRSRKRHACHANRAWGTQKYHACHAESCGAQSDLRIVAKLPLASVKVSKVPRLSRKSSQRYRKYHACHAGEPRRPIRPRMSPSFRRPLWRSLKCHTCHANRASVAENTTPVTRKAAAPNQT